MRLDRSVRKTHAALAMLLASVALVAPAHFSHAQPGSVDALAHDDVAYLTQIGLIRGHARVGHELFTQGEVDAAKIHSHSAQDQLYSSLEDAFQRRGRPGFDKELASLHRSMTDKTRSETLAYRQLTSAINAAEDLMGDTARDPTTVAAVIVNLLREAAAEYREAFFDGTLVNPREYQNAYGFTQIARVWANSLNLLRTAESEEAYPAGQVRRSRAFADLVLNYLDDLQVMWPTLVPPNRLERQAAQIFGVAARVEIAALELLQQTESR